MSGDRFDEALAEYRATRAVMDDWMAKGGGPAREVTRDEERMQTAAWELAEATYEREAQR